MRSFLDVQRLGKAYGKVAALRGATFSLDLPGVHGLIGPNGSGKTTCLHACTGLLEPTTGTASVCGVELSSPLSRHLFGFAPDDLQLPGALTGREYLAFHDAARRRRDLPRALDLCVAFGLEQALERQISTYSHGMRRKIQIVAAVMHRPSLFFLDEPFRGLDPEAVLILRDVIGSIVDSGGCVLAATHDMALAQSMCARVIILAQGSVVAHDDPAEIIAQTDAPDLETAFFRITGLESDLAERRSLVRDALGLNERREL